jgi:hypothetical protein
MSEKKFEKGHLIVSPLSGTVYFAEVMKNRPNVMSLTRKDVTNEFLGCIVEYLKVKHKGNVMQITNDNVVEAKAELVTDPKKHQQRYNMFQALLTDKHDHLTIAEFKELFEPKSKTNEGS